jgi:hypothetical protein
VVPDTAEKVTLLWRPPQQSSLDAIAVSAFTALPV